MWIGSQSSVQGLICSLTNVFFITVQPHVDTIWLFCSSKNRNIPRILKKCFEWALTIIISVIATILKKVEKEIVYKAMWNMKNPFCRLIQFTRDQSFNKTWLHNLIKSNLNK